MTDTVIYAWREEQGDVWTGEWALHRADKWVPAEAKEYILATQARADAQAAVALAIERAAAAGYRICAETRHVTLGHKIEAAISAFGDADGLAAVEALRERAERAELECATAWALLKVANDNTAKAAKADLAAELAAAKQREAGDADLLLNAYKAMLVLHRICEKSGLTAGADAANNIANQIVAAHPEMPVRASLRAALSHNGRKGE